MKAYFFSKFILLAILPLPLAAQQSPAPLTWTNTQGIVIQGDFVEVEGEAVVIRREGKTYTIPFNKLSPKSVSQARELSSVVEANAKDATPFKQTDPEHQRKLAESVLGKKGSVEIWRGSRSMIMKSEEEIPKGVIELKSLSLAEAPFTEEDAALLVGCDRLENINFSLNSVPALPLHTLKGVKDMHFDRCRISVDTFKTLGRNEMLQSISFWHTPVAVGSELINGLGCCPNLETISLCHTGISNTSLEPLVQLKKLKRLYLDGTRFNGRELAAIGKMQAIEGLSFWHCNLLELDFSVLMNLKNLSALSLGDCKLPPTALKKIAEMQNLVRLELAESDVSSEMLSALGGMKSLRYLGLDNTGIAPESLIHIKPFPNLEEVCLRGEATQVSDNGVTAILNAFPNLKIFNVNAARIGPAGFNRLAEFKLLRSLRLTDVKSMPNSSVLALSHLGELDFLDLSRSGITDSQIALLMPLKRQLGELFLYRTRITDASIPALKEMKALRRIDVSGTDITENGVSELRKALASCLVDY
ncbi:MAG: leucine-rich repeat domain-containing protein [Luteolibacter sp.]